MVYLTPVDIDFNWKQRIEKENRSSKDFDQQWGWLQKDMRDMQKKLSEMSNRSEFLKEVFTSKEEDERSVKPIPESVNHEYGWIASKKEFQNRIPEKTVTMELPSNYKLHIPYDSPYWCYLKS